MIAQFLSWIRSLFVRPSAQVISFPAPPQKVEPEPQSSDSKTEELLNAWTLRALEISSSFESEDGKPQVTGNFDGAGLTCGFLGQTVLYGEHQKMVKKFVADYGINKLNEYMPTKGVAYWSMCQQVADRDGMYRSVCQMINPWTDPRHKEEVLEPMKSELLKLWRSPEMVLIQIQDAKKTQGSWAMEKAQEFADYTKLHEPSFEHFAYFFDTHVLNGPGKFPAFEEAEKISKGDVFNWMANETGYTQKDFDRNLDLWKQLTSGMPHNSSVDLLFKLAMIRAQRSRSEFDTVTMNRRGTLALGKGWVNGSLREPFLQFKG